MASTIDQVQQSLNVLLEGWISKFTPLYLPVREMKRLMFKRIFGTGSSGGTNSEGQKLPTKKYSTTPIYISPRSLKNSPSKFKVGKTGNPIESLYFPNGYAQIKSETSAKLPLELTGRLKGGFLSEEVITEGLEAAIALPASESGKVDGLEQKYGIIFQPTAFEQEQMLEEHALLIAEQITNAMNKQ